jgi:predicted RNA-binding Zn-ribbon protein involved in translation (DUF1610 family)
MVIVRITEVIFLQLLIISLIWGFMATRRIWTTMHNNNMYTCPVCGFQGLSEPAYDEHYCTFFEICPSCGTEFGYDDAIQRS